MTRRPDLAGPRGRRRPWTRRWGPEGTLGAERRSPHAPRKDPTPAPHGPVPTWLRLPPAPAPGAPARRRLTPPGPQPTPGTSPSEPAAGGRKGGRPRIPAAEAGIEFRLRKGPLLCNSRGWDARAPVGQGREPAVLSSSKVPGASSGHWSGPDRNLNFPNKRWFTWLF